MSNNRNARFNGEGYYDPTAFEAICRTSRDERKRKDKPKREPPRVYIASPYKGDTETNVQNALRYCRFAVEQGYFPLAPHCYLPRFMDDDNPSERELALSFGLRLLNSCKELWVFGERISEGMRREIAEARKLGIHIRHFVNKCEEAFPCVSYQ